MIAPGALRAGIALIPPTFQESGLPMVYAVWFGMVSPPGTPPDVAARLSGAYTASIKTPAVQKFFEVNGYFVSSYNSPKAFSEQLQSEIDTLGPVIRKSGIKM